MNKASYIDPNTTFGLMIPDNGAVDHSPDEGSEPSPVQKPSRKRSKDSKSDEDSKKQGNGKRGRPRVESQDQSAIERRRTQIRLAQRAYRERKETTINVLEARVSELQQLVRDMYQTFIDYSERAFTSGVTSWKPSLGEDLRVAINRIIELNRLAGIDSESEFSSSLSSLSKASRRASHQSHPRGSISPAQIPSNYSASPILDPVQVSADSNVGMLAYDFPYTNSPLNDMENMEQVQQQLSAQDTMGWAVPAYGGYASGLTDQHQHQHHQMLHTGAWQSTEEASTPTYLLQSLPAPGTYAWQETTFARRLLRDGYEKVYWALSDPRRDVEALKHRFRYSLCFNNLKQLLINIKTRLYMAAREPLGNWNSPLLHIGGSGLHFPRDPAQSSTEDEPVPGYTRQRNYGPYDIKKAEKQPPAEFFPDKVAKWLGLEGQWFDSHDVEMYLRTKGLHLTGSSSTAVMEVEEEVPSMGSGQSSSGMGSPRESTSPEMATVPETMVTGMGTNDPSLQELLDMDTGDLFGYDFDLFQQDATKGIDNIQSVDMFEILDTMLEQSVKVKKKVNIGVDRLIDLLNSRSVCLGRAQGYRKEDVDDVLSQVVKDAWPHEETSTALSEGGLNGRTMV